MSSLILDSVVLSIVVKKRDAIHLSEVGRFLPCGQVNYPSKEFPCIRKIEWKDMMPLNDAEKAQGTLITTELSYTPTSPDSYEYPMPHLANHLLYEKYQTLAKSKPGLVICGRLGEYKYYDMDHAIERALNISKGILEGLQY